jgi:hypothetical protein
MATMQYDRYEKLIVVEKGIQLINWPEDVPFINASDIGSMHSLRKLHDALTHSDVEQRCRWVMLSEEEWEKRSHVFFEAMAGDPPKKRKRKVRAPESGSDSMETEDDVEVPPKRVQKARASGKENDLPQTEDVSNKRRPNRVGKRNTKCKGPGPVKTMGTAMEQPMEQPTASN